MSKFLRGFNEGVPSTYFQLPFFSKHAVKQHAVGKATIHGNAKKFTT